MQEDFRLKVFVTVAQQQSFSRAAQMLKISQPAVSQHVLELEKQLSVKLFERQYGVTVLTPAGKVFMIYAERILADYKDAQLMFTPLQKAVVRVSASEEVYDYVITDILSDFCAVHPEIVFIKSFPSEADLRVSLRPDADKKGTMALTISPSDKFASTSLWNMLSGLITRQLL
jgi:DNA-binding transcriptional LysR family regulator